MKDSVEVIPFEDGTFMLALQNTDNRQNVILDRDALYRLYTDIRRALVANKEE
jgi:hypothetical protein